MENDNITLPSKEVYYSFLNFLLILLNNQRINESKKLKNIHQEELNAGFDEDSDEDEIEEEEFYDDDELLKKCVNKILKDKKFLTTNELSLNPAELEVNNNINNSFLI